MKSFRGSPSQFVVKCESVIGVGTYGGSPAEVSGTSECHYHGRGGRGGALAVNKTSQAFARRAGPLSVRGWKVYYMESSQNTLQSVRYDSFVTRFRYR